MSDLAWITEDEVLTHNLLWCAQIMRRAYTLQESGKRNITFSVYRRGDISDTHTPLQVNAPDEVQFDGVIFEDGVTVIHWNTAVRSTSVFGSFEDILKIHAHPEYNSEFFFEGEE